MSSSDCHGCTSHSDNTTEGCCDLRLDDDGLPARCVGEWARDKHHYLGRYADIFTVGMKHKWAKRVFVDLFAGPGRCRLRPAGDFVDGSPLIAQRRSFTHAIYVDLSATCVDALTRRLRNQPGPGVDIRQGDANALVGDVHARVRGLGREALGFAFVDPPGIEIAFESLRRLTKGVRLDLLINFPLGMNIKRQYKHQLERSDAEIDAYFGTPAWRERCDPPGYEVGARLLELYEDQLRTLGYSFVGDERVIKSRGNQALYILVFASRDPKGEEFWRKVTKVEASGQRELFP